jgi:uncharacterized protein (DUF3084 family)
MKVILLLLTILLCYVAKSQDYPIIKIDEHGKQIVIMTLEQVQRLDNQTDLIPLFEKINEDVGNLDSSCLVALSDKDKVIISLDKQLDSQKELLTNKDKEIGNLNSQLQISHQIESTYKKEIENKDTEIELHLDKIKKQKGKNLIFGGIGAVIGFIFAVIFI